MLSADDKSNIAKLRTEHFLDIILFIQVFYKLRTGREFTLSSPIGRESHYITIAKALHRVSEGKCKRLIINIPPRYAKTEMVLHFVAWCMARWDDSNFIYVSYSHSLAKKQTQTIREIISLPQYKALFAVELAGDTTAKDNFETTNHGSVYAVGSGGTITGRGAGIKNTTRFGGAIICDDLLKPDEAASDIVREGINEWYYNTLQSRLNDPNTPIILIGQRLHEDDISARLLATGEWEMVVLPALDDNNNALLPEMHPAHVLKKMQLDSPYVFAAQYQQDPQPAGGGIFKPEWFTMYDYEPEILETFITADSAETDKNYNDATVFSFWGIYEIKQFGANSGIYGLHCIDCRELRVEPKDLLDEFMDFYRGCMQHTVKPRLAAVEKKSTGVTLVSTLQGLQGLQVMDIQRTKASGSKVQRFLEIQPYVSTGRISLPTYGKHTRMFIDHMKKITANDTHRFDDIADTVVDAVKIALIDKIIETRVKPRSDTVKLGRQLGTQQALVSRLKDSRRWN